MFIMSIGKGGWGSGRGEYPRYMSIVVYPPTPRILTPWTYPPLPPLGYPSAPLGLLSPSPLGYPPPGILAPLVIPTPCYWHLVQPPKIPTRILSCMVPVFNQFRKILGHFICISYSTFLFVLQIVGKIDQPFWTKFVTTAWIRPL